MKAVQYHRYGPPEVLELVDDAPDPEPAPGQALVRVIASSVNALEWHSIRGEPFLARLQAGLTRPRHPGIGADVAGVVAAVGPGVTTVHVGDEVFGMSIRTWAELVPVKAEGLVPKPADVSWEAAGCVGVAGLTALQGIRRGGVGPGQVVLVSGAGGGVGHYAVQIAKALGASVTAATSADKLEMVRSIGADDVVDYATTDATAAGNRFDAIFDAGGWLGFGQLRRGLRPGGVAIMAGAGPSPNLAGIAARLIGARVRSRLESRRYVSYLANRTQDDLQELRAMLADGRLRPFIDRRFEIDEIRDAVRYQETGHTRGKVAIAVGQAPAVQGSGADTRI